MSNKDKDFIAGLVDNESHKTTRRSFILHDILEDNYSSEAIIEGGSLAAKNVKQVLTNNISHKVVYRKIKKGRI